MADDWGYFGSGSSGYGHYMTAFHRNSGGGGGGGKKPPKKEPDKRDFIAYAIAIIIALIIFRGFY